MKKIIYIKYFSLIINNATLDYEVTWLHFNNMKYDLKKGLFIKITLNHL